MAFKRSQILLCGGTGCTSSGSQTLVKEFKKELIKHELMDEVELVITGCFGLCELGPVVIVYPEGTFYSRVEPSDIPELVEEHLVKGRPLERLIRFQSTNSVFIKNRNVSRLPTAALSTLKILKNTLLLTAIWPLKRYCSK